MAGTLTAAIAAAFSGSAVTADPYYEYTTLLLPGNGTNGAQNNTFLDGSTNNFTITRNGNTTQGTFSPFSQTGWGNYFDGNGDYLTAPSNSAFDFSTSNFTIECWVYLTAYSINWSGSYNASIISRDANTGASSGRNYWLNINGTSSSWTGLSFGFFSGSTLSTKSESYAFSLNTWYNIAVVRSSGQVNFYVNGSVVGSGTTMSSAPNTNAIPVYIGQQGYSTAEYYFPGYISNLRLVNGVAVYTGNFTPSTSALTATQSAGTNINAITTGQTKLLTCQSNRFVDNGQGNTSNTPFTLTVYGNTSVQAFSPFNPTASWSAATYGGSGYFDGSGDSLSVASNTALQLTGEFTMEAWYYPVGFPGAGVFDSLIATGDNAPSSNAIAIYISSSGGIQLYNHVTSTAIFNTASGVVLNAWNHIAATRNSSNGVDLWLNGVSQGSTVTVSSSFTSTTPTRIGTSSINQDCYGYISNVRIVKGVAVYTSAFTPPTAPLTAITNTSLLLNFTNAGIYDATSKNDLETVGNAQISTAISAKWGSGSIKLASASTDYLKMPSSNLLVLGTGDWTIESWVYLPSVAAQQIIFDTRATGTDSGYAFYVSGSGKLALYTNNTSVLVSTSSVPSNSWAYLAMTRTGATVRAYINGVLDATTGTYSGSMNCPGSGLVGAGAGGTDLVNGYIQDLRITKGYARTITASPTAAFPTL